MTPTPHPTPQTYPIVCLEHQDSVLFAEIVQVVAGRHRCWLRPLWLQIRSSSAAIAPPEHSTPAAMEIYDLRGSSDLLWSQNAFRAALDVEILPILTYCAAETAADPTELYADPAMPTQAANQQLHHFLRQLWQAQVSH